MMSVDHLSYTFLSCMMNGVCIDLRSFLATQLYSAATSTTSRIVIRDIITPIALSLGIEPNRKDRVSGSEGINKATFE